MKNNVFELSLSLQLTLDGVRVDMIQTREASSACTTGALEDKHHVTPGPDDMTVLYLQDQHQSKDIWSGHVS